MLLSARTGEPHSNFRREKGGNLNGNVAALERKFSRLRSVTSGNRLLSIFCFLVRILQTFIYDANALVIVI